MRTADLLKVASGPIVKGAPCETVRGTSPAGAQVSHSGI